MEHHYVRALGSVSLDPSWLSISSACLQVLHTLTKLIQRQEECEAFSSHNLLFSERKFLKDPGRFLYRSHWTEQDLRPVPWPQVLLGKSLAFLAFLLAGGIWCQGRERGMAVREIPNNVCCKRDLKRRRILFLRHMRFHIYIYLYIRQYMYLLSSPNLYCLPHNRPVNQEMIVGQEDGGPVYDHFYRSSLCLAKNVYSVIIEYSVLYMAIKSNLPSHNVQNPYWFCLWLLIQLWLWICFFLLVGLSIFSLYILSPCYLMHAI